MHSSHRWRGLRHASVAIAGSCRRCRRPTRPLSARLRASGTLSSIQQVRRGKVQSGSTKSGPLDDHSFAAVGDQALAQIGSAAILPHDRVGNRLAGLPIPDQRSLALIGYTDRGNARRIERRLPQNLPHGRERRVPEIVRIVLNPSRMRVDLLELPLSDRYGQAVGPEGDGARRGGALIDREDIFHRCTPELVASTARAAPGGALVGRAGPNAGPARLPGLDQLVVVDGDRLGFSFASSPNRQHCYHGYLTTVARLTTFAS